MSYEIKKNRLSKVICMGCNTSYMMTFFCNGCTNRLNLCVVDKKLTKKEILDA